MTHVSVHQIVLDKQASNATDLQHIQTVPKQPDTAHCSNWGIWDSTFWAWCTSACEHAVSRCGVHLCRRPLRSSSGGMCVIVPWVVVCVASWCIRLMPKSATCPTQTITRLSFIHAFIPARTCPYSHSFNHPFLHASVFTVSQTFQKPVRTNGVTHLQKHIL